jgi:hypothetical protein
MNLRGQTAVALLRSAADTIEERAAQYNGESDMFEQIAFVTALSIEKVFDVFIATKDARLSANPEHLDSLIDLLAYTALQHSYALPLDAHSHLKLRNLKELVLKDVYA